MTFLGDTGLWFVPTAEVLANLKFSTSVQSSNIDLEQGFTDIQHYIGTFAVGVGKRTEIFGSFRFRIRIDRDLRPLFRADLSRIGGVVNDCPFVSDQFSGNAVGDFLVGAKFNLLSKSQLKPVAIALRGLIKLPIGNRNKGTTTGEVDGELDVIMSATVGNRHIKCSGFGGFIFRTDPTDINLTNGIR